MLHFTIILEILIVAQYSKSLLQFKCPVVLVRFLPWSYVLVIREYDPFAMIGFLCSICDFEVISSS